MTTRYNVEVIVQRDYGVSQLMFGVNLRSMIDGYMAPLTYFNVHANHGCSTRAYLGRLKSRFEHLQYEMSYRGYQIIKLAG